VLLLRWRVMIDCGVLLSNSRQPLEDIIEEPLLLPSPTRFLLFGGVSEAASYLRKLYVCNRQALGT